MDIKELSVFFPAVNEEDNIRGTVEQADEVLKKLDIKYEIIIVDDGSKDQTAQIVRDLAEKNSKIRLISHDKNLGYGSALKTGFKNAKYSWVAFSDSDGQFDFSEITLLLDRSDQADLVLGYRIKRADSFSRKVFTFGWGLIARIFLGLDARDYSCGFKLIKKEVFDSVQPLEGEEKVTQIEFLVKARRMGYKFAEVGVHHFPRQFGIPTGAKLNVVFKSLVDLFKLWWQLNDHKWSFFALMAILSIATFFRFYRLDEYMTFLGDEGRDALIIRSLLVEGNIPFIGPPTSVGNIYLGPLYYYMMAIPMAIFWLSPVGAAGMVAFIGVLTVLMIYYVGKKWFSEIAGLTSALLYAISPITITASRSSWNPNPAPFFTLMAIFFFYLANKNKNLNWLILCGVFVGAAVQMHYLALILVPAIVILWINELIRKYIYLEQINNFVKGTVGFVVAFWFMLIPLILFDLKHYYLNLRAIIELFTDSQAVSTNILTIFGKILPLYSNNLVGRHLSLENSMLTLILSFFALMPFLRYFSVRVHNKSSWPTFALFVWLVVGLVGLSFYQKSVYDHYLGFLNPVPFLLIGSAVALCLQLANKYRAILVGMFICILVFTVYVNLSKNNLLSSPGNQLKRTQEIAKVIIQDSQGRPFNFALIAGSNYDAAYQFYLDIYHSKPDMIPFDVAEQMFVVCEDSVCDPVHSSKYEVAGFGMSKVEWMKEVYGVKIYKLVHNPTGSP